MNPKDLIGNYTLKSPYHKNKRLPFNILSYGEWRGEYPFKVHTEEYKGKKRFDVDCGYKKEAIEHFIKTGLIVKQ